MDKLIKNLNITTDDSLSTIEELLISIPPYSPNYQLIIKLGISDYSELAIKIFNYVSKSEFHNDMTKLLNKHNKKVNTNFTVDLINFIENYNENIKPKPLDGTYPYDHYREEIW